MLTPYRRHRDTCKHISRRYKSCSCPIWVQGVLDGKTLRRSLDLTSWEAANRKIREMEIYGEGKALSVREAVEHFLAERKSNRLGEAMFRKYRHAMDELVIRFGEQPVRSITLLDL